MSTKKIRCWSKSNSESRICWKIKYIDSINVQEQIRIRIRNVKDKWENFQDEELSHELFLTAKQTTKMRNAIASKMIEWGGLLLNMLGNLE